jgi:hypothetical protein
MITLHSYYDAPQVYADTADINMYPCSISDSLDGMTRSLFPPADLNNTGALVAANPGELLVGISKQSAETMEECLPDQRHTLHVRFPTESGEDPCHSQSSDSEPLPLKHELSGTIWPFGGKDASQYYYNDIPSSEDKVEELSTEFQKRLDELEKELIKEVCEVRGTFARKTN